MPNHFLTLCIKGFKEMLLFMALVKFELDLPPLAAFESTWHAARPWNIFGYFLLWLDLTRGSTETSVWPCDFGSTIYEKKILRHGFRIWLILATRRPFEVYQLFEVALIREKINCSDYEKKPFEWTCNFFRRVQMNKMNDSKNFTFSYEN